MNSVRLATLRFTFTRGIVFTSLFAAVLIIFACSKKEDPPKPEEPMPVQRSLQVNTLATGLQIPWGLVYLPDGDLLFSERGGRLSLLKKNQSGTMLITSRPVSTTSEGGMLGLALDPLYASNHFLYAYESTDSNRVVRFTYWNDVLIEDKIIVRGIPFNGNHDGGALKFGPDGYLYIGTGDAQTPNLAQDLGSLAGKILRVDRDGNVPLGNPFNTRMWSYGHRNVQGFAWTNAGTMLATEHGPTIEFGWCCHDEINLIQPGKNYGWPLAIGGTETGTLTAPVAHSGNDTWAPSGCAYMGKDDFWPNCLVVGCLRGQKLNRFYLSDDGASVRETRDTFFQTFHRIRNVIRDNSGALIFGSSNSGTDLFMPLDDRLYTLKVK